MLSDLRQARPLTHIKTGLIRSLSRILIFACLCNEFLTLRFVCTSFCRCKRNTVQNAIKKMDFHVIWSVGQIEESVAEFARACLLGFRNYIESSEDLPPCLLKKMRIVVHDVLLSVGNFFVENITLYCTIQENTPAACRGGVLTLYYYFGC